MRLLFLGTGAGIPSKSRNVSAIVLQLLEERGTEWLFDCGEATQHQVLRAPVKLHRLERVFITHMHGDHVFGLPGLLSSRSFQGATSPLTLYGPSGLKAFVEIALSASQTFLTYPLHVQEVEPGVILADEQFTVTCRPLEHVVRSYGYRIVEKDRAGALRTDLLAAQNVPPGPLYGRLKAGESVTLADGTVLHGLDYLAPPLPGRKVAILGDTRPCDASVELAAKADVLVHESTFLSDAASGAHEFGHSTARDAALIAKRAGVDTLILTHVSARYLANDSRLLAEAQAIHPNTVMAADFFSWPIEAKSAHSK